VLVASNAYLKGKPAIKTPANLAAHAGILIRSPQSGRIATQVLRNGAGEQVAIDLSLRIAMSDPNAACLAAVEGLGIALAAMPQASPYLKSGALKRVLPDWYVDAGTISIYFAAHKLLPAKTRAFIDFVVEQCRAQRWSQLFSV
jgi:DNA-binding transcriptional LysR family regulator